MRLFHQLPCLLLALCGAVARADEASASWVLSAGGDFGQDGSRGYAASADFASAADRFTFALAGQRTTSPTVAASADPVDSTSGQIALGGRVGTVHLELGFDATRDEDLRRSTQVSGGLTWGAHGWNSRVGLSRRHTDFDDFPVTATITLRNGASFDLSGSVGCEVDDTGYAARIGYAAERWDAYVSGNLNDFEPIACGYSSAVPRELRRLNAARFSELAGRRSQSLTQRVGGRIGQESQLLDSLYGAGYARHFDAFSLAFDYSHSTAAFDTSEQDGYAVTGSWPFTGHASVDLTLGVTAQGSDTTPYAGLQFNYLL